MKTPHKHAELIKAWADGEKIQVHDKLNKVWRDSLTPIWDSSLKYRIQQEPKPDVTAYFKSGNISRAMATMGANVGVINTDRTHANLKLTYDGETGKLKSAEVI